MMIFDIDMIHKNFLDVQSHFGEINNKINCQRDFFGDDVIAQLLCAYQHINKRLVRGTRRNFLDYHTMLELNAIVLTGVDPKRRKESKGFLEETEKKYARYFEDLAKWYKRHEESGDDPFKIAAGLYVRVLARPQLFIEGNHRTGALIANYHLMISGNMPFILTPPNAVEFFNLASDVKFKKEDIKSRFKRATGWRDELSRMTSFLRGNTGAFACPSRPAMDKGMAPIVPDVC